MVLHPAFMDVKDVSDSALLIRVKRELSSKRTDTRKFFKITIADEYNFLYQITHDIVVKEGVKFVFNFFLHIRINKFNFSDKLESFILLLLSF